MADVLFTDLPALTALSGQEIVPVDSPNGDGTYTTSRTTAGAIANTLTAADFVLVDSNPLVPTARVLTGTAGDISLEDSGPGGTLTIDLVSTAVAAGTYGDSTHVPRVTVDAKGRVTAASNIAIGGGTVTSVGLAMPTQFSVSGSPVTNSGTLTAAWNAQSANTVLAGPASGGAVAPTFRALTDTDLPGGVTGTGAVALAGSPALTGAPTAPTQTIGDNSTKIATTAYVQASLSGTTTLPASGYATTAALPTVTYSNGSSGVGATLTAVAVGALTVDGVAQTIGNIVLVKNQASSFQNGIYTVTVGGSVGAAFILTRTTYYDEAGQIDLGDTTFVTAGNTLASTAWTQNGTENPIIGTNPITFAQTAGPGSFVAGNGIAISGTSIAIDTSVTVDKTTAQTLSNKTLVAPALGTPTALVATNATGTAAGLTAGTATVANALKTATTSVVVSGATAPTAGQVLTATSSTAAIWAPAGGGVTPVATRTVMAGTSSSLAVVYLEEAGRVGVFQWSSANLSTQVTLDTAQGVYVPPTSDTTGASGAWVRQYDGPMWSNWCGTVTTGTATDTAMAAAIAVAAIMPGGILGLVGGTYTLTAQTDFSAINGIQLEGPVTFDFTSATVVGNFASGGFVYVGGAALVALPNLGSNAVKAAQSVVFASTPSLNYLDRFCIYNPTAGSFSGFNAAYTAGEWCQVTDTSGGATIALAGPLYAAYTTGAVSLYKHPNKKFSVRGGILTILESANSALNNVAGFRADRIVDSDFSAIRPTNSGYAGMYLNQCIGISGVGYVSSQYRIPGNGTNYGIILGNCQDCRIQGQFHGGRIGSAFGGAAGPGAVPTRNISFAGSIITSEPAGGFQAADMHGCCEYCDYDNCQMDGLAIGGNHVSARNSRIILGAGRGGVAIQIVQPLGYDIDISGSYISTQEDAATVGVLNGANTSTGFTANTTHGGHLNLDNTTWDCPVSNTLVRITNSSGTTSEQIVCTMEGADWPQTSSGSPQVLLSAILGTATRVFDRMSIAGFNNGPAASWTLAAPTLCLVAGWKASGVATITPAVSSTSASTAVTFPNPAPKTPAVIATMSDGTIVGGVKAAPYTAVRSATGANIGLTATSTAFTSTTSSLVSWLAVLDEC